MCRSKSVPYLDFGYGHSPSKQEYTVPILAIAWDCLIQLVYFDENEIVVKMDGFYCSESEINSIYFMGDSCLLVLVDQTKIKLLYTKKFHNGDFSYMDAPEFKEDFKVQYKRMIDFTRHAELDSNCPLVKGVRRQLIEMD